MSGTGVIAVTGVTGGLGGRVARRWGKKTAVVALARTLLTIAFHLLQDWTTYDARRLRNAA